MISQPFHPRTQAHRRFMFERDTFAYPNELVWEYRFDPATGARTTQFNAPPPTYAHRCFVMVRSARQFFYHARFDPTQPVAEEGTYRRLVAEIVSRSPRRISPEEARVVIPGYDGLRSFSAARERLLKAVCGGAWQSYVLRSHWRMILPISRRHQARMARQLIGSLAESLAPIVHLLRFPQLTINHGIVLCDLLETEPRLRFAAYDPNLPSHPTELGYDPASRTFSFPANHYWAGGRVDVVEAYCGWFY
jgi:hypothetical protein